VICAKYNYFRRAIIPSLLNTYYSGIFYKGMIITSKKDTTHSKCAEMFSTNARFTRHSYNAAFDLLSVSLPMCSPSLSSPANSAIPSESCDTFLSVYRPMAFITGPLFFRKKSTMLVMLIRKPGQLMEINSVQLNRKVLHTGYQC